MIKKKLPQIASIARENNKISELPQTDDNFFSQTVINKQGFRWKNNLKDDY